MYTATLLLWMFSIIYFFYFAYRYWGSKSYDWFTIAVLGELGISIVSLLIGVALLNDFGDAIPTPIDPEVFLFFFWGWILLAITLIVALLIPSLSRGRNIPKPIYRSDTEKIINILVQIIGIVKSILEIITIYMDHMR